MLVTQALNLFFLTTTVDTGIAQEQLGASGSDEEICGYLKEQNWIRGSGETGRKLSGGPGEPVPPTASCL